MASKPIYILNPPELSSADASKVLQLILDLLVAFEGCYDDELLHHRKMNEPPQQPKPRSGGLFCDLEDFDF